METRLKLAIWVAGTGKKKKDVAKMLGIKPATLSSFLSGKSVPGAQSKFLIQQNTGGHIKMEEWK